MASKYKRCPVVLIMFLLVLGTMIVTLLWSVQFVAVIHSTTTLVWLNAVMIFAWLVLCIRFVRVHGCPEKKDDCCLKDSNLKYTELVHTEQQQDIENKIIK